MRSTRPLAKLAVLLVSTTLVYAAFTACSKKAEPPADTSGSTSNTTTPPSDTSAKAPAATNTSGTTADANAVTANLELGEQVYKQRCALCHGPDGHGNGPGAAALNPKPRNYHDAKYMNSKTDAELLATIHNGKGAMPAWKAVLSETQMKSVLMYERTFASKP
jgi:mono/diheme cytochrome c family protein